MAYRTKIEVRTMGKVYKAGSILPDDISKIDLDFQRRRKFVELVDDAGISGIAEEDDEPDVFDELDPEEYKSADEIKKIRKKDDLYKYALSIGLDLGDEYEEKKVADLAEEIINYQEEKEAEAGEDM